MPTNECIPYKEPGERLTATATATVTGKRLLAISAAPQADGSYSVAHASSGGGAIGVSSWDAAIGARLGILRGGYVLPVTADGSIAAGAPVEVGAAGKVKTLASGVQVGVNFGPAVTDGNDARIALFEGGQAGAGTGTVVAQAAPDDAEDSQASLITDAETAHELDDTSLATLESSTEDALDALGTAVNALETAVIDALDAQGTTINEIIAALVAAGVFT